MTTDEGEGAFSYSGNMIRRDTVQPSHDMEAIKENHLENESNAIAEEPENKEDNDSINSSPEKKANESPDVGVGE